MCQTNLPAPAVAPGFHDMGLLSVVGSFCGNCVFVGLLLVAYLRLSSSSSRWIVLCVVVLWRGRFVEPPTVLLVVLSYGILLGGLPFFCLPYVSEFSRHFSCAMSADDTSRRARRSHLLQHCGLGSTRRQSLLGRADKQPPAQRSGACRDCAASGQGLGQPHQQVRISIQHRTAHSCLTACRTPQGGREPHKQRQCTPFDLRGCRAACAGLPWPPPRFARHHDA